MAGADGETSRHRHAAASPKTGSEQQGTRAPHRGSGLGDTGLGEEPLLTQSPVQIASDYRAEFARCLEPLLLLGPRRAVSTSGGANT